MGLPQESRAVAPACNTGNVDKQWGNEGAKQEKEHE